MSTAMPLAPSNSLAQPIDSTPEPQPRSKKRLQSSSREIASRHSRVDGWPPVPNARPGSMSITTSPPAAEYFSQLGTMTKRPTLRGAKNCFQT
jgi:hypothetical protein